MTIYGNLKLYRCPHVDPNRLSLKRIVGNSKYFPRKGDISFLILLELFQSRSSNVDLRTLTYERPSNRVIIIDESALLVFYLSIYFFLSLLPNVLCSILSCCCLIFYNNNLFLMNCIHPRLIE